MFHLLPYLQRISHLEATNCVFLAFCRTSISTPCFRRNVISRCAISGAAGRLFLHDIGHDNGTPSICFCLNYKNTALSCCVSSVSFITCFLIYAHITHGQCTLFQCNLWNIIGHEEISKNLKLKIAFSLETNF